MTGEAKRKERSPRGHRQPRRTRVGTLGFPLFKWELALAVALQQVNFMKSLGGPIDCQ